MTRARTKHTSVKPASRRPWPLLLHRVVKTIRSKQLFDKGHHLLIAVSGGPDSVALLSLLHRLQSSWRLTLTAVHFNYGLRGRESDQDQAFVAALCHSLGIPLYTRRLDVSRRSRRTSLQAEARALRYRAMASIASECGAGRIALGHTADDQAETVLLWMLRGAGLTGLSGMPVSREGHIIRPLYESTREEVLAYLTHEARSYRQDSSNAKLLYVRNQIRHEILPSLKQRFPSSIRALCRLADLCREDDRFLDDYVAELIRSHVRVKEGGWVVDRVFARGLPLAVQRRLMRELLRRCDASAKAPSVRTIERVLHEVERRAPVTRLAVGHADVIITKDEIHVEPPEGHEVSAQRPRQVVAQPLPVPSELFWTGTDQTIRVEERERNAVSRVASGPHRIVVDAGRFSRPLIVRGWEAGDRFCPSGMKGRSKKLQDYFMDLKVPAGERGNIPLVVAPEGIVWIVGYRQDERWAVTEETRHCLVFTARAASHREGVV